MQPIELPLQAGNPILKPHSRSNAVALNGTSTFIFLDVASRYLELPVPMKALRS